MADGDHHLAEHTVIGVELRVQLAQSEFHRQCREGTTWLPYVYDAFASLPERIGQHIAAERPREADYWLVQAERFVRILAPQQFQDRITALLPLESDSAA